MMYRAASPWAKLSGASWLAPGRRAAPGLLGLLQRAVLLDRNCAELPAEFLLRRTLDALARPEQQRVFVLNLDDRQRRVLRQGDAGVGVRFGEHLFHPVLVGRLEFLVEEQQAPIARPARIEHAHRRLDAGRAGPVGRVGDVNPSFFIAARPFQRWSRSVRSMSIRSLPVGVMLLWKRTMLMPRLARKRAWRARSLLNAPSLKPRSVRACRR